MYQTELESVKKITSQKTIIVTSNCKSTGKRIKINYDGSDNKIDHHRDAYILSEAISILIRDYKKNGGNDASLLRMVVSNLENNFIEVSDTVTRGKKNG